MTKVIAYKRLLISGILIAGTLGSGLIDLTNLAQLIMLAFILILATKWIVVDKKEETNNELQGDYEEDQRKD